MLRLPVQTYRNHFVFLPPNRVWRTYHGGRVLDRLTGVSQPTDSHFPEDWIASTTRAVNIGREHLSEGVSSVEIGGTRLDFPTLLSTDPEYFLGAAHVAKYGCDLRLLVKLLDSAIRLHFQVHPTAAFARQFLGSASGKTEAYHVLSTRPGAQRYIYLGFQRPPSRAALKRMIEAQDIAGIEACFDPIPVNPGDTYLVPGGVPHALGEGVFLVEIQEPSDLVVRFEFERGGFVLPEPARFMNRGLDFCLDLFDFTPRPFDKVFADQRCLPRRREIGSKHSWSEALIGPEQTPCFAVNKFTWGDRVVRTIDRPSIAIITQGSLQIQSSQEVRTLQPYDKVFFPAGIGDVVFTPTPYAAMLECLPPA